MRVIVRSIVAMAAAVALLAIWSVPAVAQARCLLSDGPDVRQPASPRPSRCSASRSGSASRSRSRARRSSSTCRPSTRRPTGSSRSTSAPRGPGARSSAAIVSSREHMRPAELRRIRERFVALREGRGGRHDSLRDSPAIVWLAGNVHGGEKSGADSELKVLYELAARTDCDVRKLNDDLVTVIMPSQNPDGREASRRQNDYGFDLNRDWFARTQPETEAKVELLRRWPGQVFVDAHEMGGRRVLLPAERRPDPPRDRRRAGVVDQRHRRGQQGRRSTRRSAATAPARRRSPRSATSTTTSTTCSSWATATPCPRPDSARRG